MLSARCARCGKITWSGCGLHIDAVMTSVQPLSGARAAERPPAGVDSPPQDARVVRPPVRARDTRSPLATVPSRAPSGPSTQGGTTPGTTGVWNADILMGNHSQQVLTDGRVVLVPMFDPERGAILVAFDPEDGSKRWSAALPEGVNYLVAVEGRLLDLVALG